MRAALGRAITSEGDARVTALLVVLLGGALLAHPLYLWPHYGQTQVEALAEPAETATDFEELPPAAQQVFRQATANSPGITRRPVLLRLRRASSGTRS